MRGGRLSTDGSASRFEENDRFYGGSLRQDTDETPWLRDRLQIGQDNPGVLIFTQIRNEIVYIDIRLIPGRDDQLEDDEDDDFGSLDDEIKTGQINYVNVSQKPNYYNDIEDRKSVV